MATTRYPETRKLLHGVYRSLPDRAVERVVAQHGLEAGAVEDFLGDLGNIVSAALPVVGGAVGSIIAPGVGTAIGAGLGSAAGSALHGAIGPAQPGAPAAVPPTAAAQFPYGTMPGMPQYPGMPYPGMPSYPAMNPAVPAASSQQAAGQLMQLLMRPQFLQALAQMLLGGAGSPTVPVGATPVPVSAFTNLLSTLGAQASEAYNAERGGDEPATPLYGGGYGPRVDVASEEARAGALMSLLHESSDTGGAWRRQRRRQRLGDVVEALRTVAANRTAAA